MSSKFSPTKVRRRRDLELVTSVFIRSKFQGYSNELNPFKLGTLEFERFKKYYIKEKENHDWHETLFFSMNLESLAKEWVESDPQAIKQDVEEMGCYGAAEYSAELASDQPEWEKLNSNEGIQALEKEIREFIQEIEG